MSYSNSIQYIGSSKDNTHNSIDDSSKDEDDKNEEQMFKGQRHTNRTSKQRRK